MNIHLAVDIETDQGVFQRTNSQPVNVATTGTVWSPSYGVLMYPDRRASTMRVYAEDGANYRLVKTFTLTPAKKGNYAFVLVSTIDLSVFESAELLAVDGYNDANERTKNQIRVSETSQPFTFLADKSYTVGQSASEEIRAFSVNSLDISSGQFGQYPLFVFCKDSVWALEQGRDITIAFERISPVSLSHGVDRAEQVTNVGRTIVFLYQEGIFALAGNEINEIGQPIGNYPGEIPINFNDLSITARQRSGAYELLVSTGSVVYAYNMKYGVWYMVDRPRKWFFTVGGALYSVDSSGEMYDEQEPTTTPVNFVVDMDVVHFLEPEVLKRLFALYLRGKFQSQNMSVWLEGEDTVSDAPNFSTANTAMRVKAKSVFSFRIKVNGYVQPGTDYFQAITSQIEARYPHRTKVTI